MRNRLIFKVPSAVIIFDIMNSLPSNLKNIQRFAYQIFAFFFWDSAPYRRWGIPTWGRKPVFHAWVIKENEMQPSKTEISNSYWMRHFPIEEGTLKWGKKNIYFGTGHTMQIRVEFSSPKLETYLCPIRTLHQSMKIKARQSKWVLDYITPISWIPYSYPPTYSQPAKSSEQILTAKEGALKHGTESSCQKCLSLPIR